MSQRPLTATDSGWGLQCQDCKPHGGAIEGKATNKTTPTQRQDLEDCCHMHRQLLLEGKTHRGWTDLSRNTQLSTGTERAWTFQSGLSRQELTRPYEHAEVVTNWHEHKSNTGELSSDKRSLHVSGNRMRQSVWEGVCMLNNNRYQHISIDIHTQTGGETCVHIVIGRIVGEIDMSCITGQTGYNAKRTHSGPLNHHRDYPQSAPWCLQLVNSREPSRGPPHSGPTQQPDQNANHAGQLILLHPEQGRNPSSLSYVSDAGIRGAARLKHHGQEYTVRSDTPGPTETTARSEHRDDTPDPQREQRPRKIHSSPKEAELLNPLIERHKEDKEWLREQGGAILRRILHMLRGQACEPQTEQMDDCLRRLTMGHQHATAAWIWQVIGLTWDPDRVWTAEHFRKSQ